MLKSNSVRLYVWPYYIAITLWGIYGTFYAAPNATVAPVMGPTIYNAWIWLCIAAPLATMIGMLAPGHGKQRYLGEGMQLGGNIGVGFVLTAFEYSALAGTPWGRGSFIVFVIPPYILGCTFLALRNALEIYETQFEDQ